MEFYFAVSTFLKVLYNDFLSLRNKGNILNRAFILAPPRIRLHCLILIVKSHTWANHIDYGNAIMHKSSFEELSHLFNISSKCAGNKFRPADQSLQAQI